MSGSSGGSYLQHLNALPPTETDDADAFSPDDLAIFTNTRFFDFDMGPEERREGGNRAVEDGGGGGTRTDLAEGDELIDLSLKSGSMNFLNDFDPYDYGTYPFGSFPSTSTRQPTPSPLAMSANIDRDFTPGVVSPENPHHHHPVAPPPPPAPLSESSSPGQSPYPIAPSPSSRGMRTRKASTASSSEHIQSPSSEQFNFGGDESGSASRAADEDKRRRNTAASARFRVKKKEKEAQLAKDAKDAAEKVKLMEARIKKLEEQNEWLKSLLLEKKRALPKVQETAGESVATKEKGS